MNEQVFNYTSAVIAHLVACCRPMTRYSFNLL
jgi:hypothetical protein